jgi:DMSO/TMAO reductase YedYZ molybdopterin-dependent catalytic subunit
MPRLKLTSAWFGRASTVSAKPTATSRQSPQQRVAVGRRVFLGLVGLGAAGIVFGAKVQSVLDNVVGSGLGGLLPLGNHFRIYSISDTFPVISRSEYRLEVTGLVDRPRAYTIDDLESMPRTAFVKDFHCVTGWSVPSVHWEGVRLADILDDVGVQKAAVALRFESYDGADSESLTLDQARLPDVIVAYRMLGAPVTTEHGGPVRLYVAPMFGYKSLKWLSAIEVVDKVVPGYWEQNGYPLNGWIDGSTGATDPSLTGGAA